LKSERSFCANYLAGTHDLSLSAWGPYSKRYIGVSHVPDPRSGVRVDFSLMPGLYRRETIIPNVKWVSGFHPWLAGIDLSFYRYRFEIEWKDRVYCDIDFCRLDDHHILTAGTFVNNTAVSQNTTLHHFAYLTLPPLRESSEVPLRPSRIQLPEGGVWLSANSYTEISFTGNFPTRSLQWDGHRAGEIRADGLTGGFGLGKDAVRPGTRILYSLGRQVNIGKLIILLRYRMPQNNQARLTLTGLGQAIEVLLQGENDFSIMKIALSENITVSQFTITIHSGAELEIDGFALLPAGSEKSVSWIIDPPGFTPARLETGHPAQLMLKYPAAEPVYGLAWDNKFDFDVRDFLCEDLDCTLRYSAHNHVSKTITGMGEGHYTNVYQRPIVLKPQSQRTVYSLLCCGTEKSVRASLAAFTEKKMPFARLHRQARKKNLALTPLTHGKTYQFSQEMMAANILTAVVYPVRTRGAWIKHNTPGRWWDCLYTWDSGFSALGLAELDISRAVESLNAYVTEPGDPSAAFIHHGSPVPTQFYAFAEIWNRTQSRELAAFFFPRLRQYHRFLAGRADGSVARTLKSNLLKTWDYFYNSGGWDDYPAQVATHKKKITSTVTPAVNTAHAVRTAKILRSVGLSIGESVAEFDEDIAVLSEALQKWSWDEAAGYFSYVTHDKDGQAAGFLYHEGGQNFNMGLDGTAPLVTGTCTPDQEKKLVAALITPGRLWSDCGISTVDQKAAYYRRDGYWNGAVWMPHQWFMWKALLDLGEGDAAYRIADTALRIWKAEVEESYHCFEHFIAATGRGAGWHQFTGLSSPVLAWYSAYHRPGRLTTGFDGVVTHCRFQKNNRGMEAALLLTGQARHRPTIIVTLEESRDYTATWCGEKTKLKMRLPGVAEITLPEGEGEGQLKVN